jgi:hypothetical protein
MIDEESEVEKNFAKYELQTALLDGLFEPTRKIKDGHLRLREIETHHDYRDLETGKVSPKAIYLKLRVPYFLGTGAESLFLAILKLIGEDRLAIDPLQPCLPLLLRPEEGAMFKNAGAAITTEHHLMQEAGMSVGKNDYRLFRKYLDWMSMVHVYYENHATGWRGADWFLRYSTHEDGSLIVQVNWRLAGAAFSDYLHAEIDLSERHSLKKDATKTLHRWLSAHIWEGKSGYLRYETLSKHIWTEKASATAQRKRLERLRNEILPDLASLPNWTIAFGSDGVSIKRGR